MDLWKHGKYLDLWSLVHLLSGVVIAALLFHSGLHSFEVFLITFFLAALWEAFEAAMGIIEDLPNLSTDVIIAMVGYVIVFYFNIILEAPLAPALIFWLLAINGALSLWGFLDFKKRGYR